MRANDKGRTLESPSNVGSRASDERKSRQKIDRISWKMRGEVHPRSVFSDVLEKVKEVDEVEMIRI